MRSCCRMSVSGGSQTHPVTSSSGSESWRWLGGPKGGSGWVESSHGCDEVKNDRFEICDSNDRGNGRCCRRPGGNSGARHGRRPRDPEKASPGLVRNRISLCTVVHCMMVDGGFMEMGNGKRLPHEERWKEREENGRGEPIRWIPQYHLRIGKLNSSTYRSPDNWTMDHDRSSQDELDTCK